MKIILLVMALDFSNVSVRSMPDAASCEAVANAIRYAAKLRVIVQCVKVEEE